jgi:hypothetical protein
MNLQDQLQQQSDPTIVDMVRYFNEHGFSIEHHPAALQNVKLTTIREFLEQAGWKQLKVKGESDQ